MSDPTPKTTIVRYGVVLTLASAGLMGLLNKWEPDHKNPGLVYADKLAKGLPTVCKGITKYSSPYPLVVGDIWSEERCAEVEQMAISKTQYTLADCMKVAINQNTFDALSSHAHNFGVYATCASRAVGLINSGRLAEGCHAIAYTENGEPNWSFVKDAKGNKVFVRGLFERRKEEAAICITPAGKV